MKRGARRVVAFPMDMVGVRVGAFPMDMVGRRGDGAFSLFMIVERMAVCSSEIT